MSITLIIIIITGLISYRAFEDRSLFDKLKHHPYTETRHKEWYRMLSVGLVHGDMTHLLVNMFVLYSFGEYVEHAFIGIFGDVMGRVNYVLLYVLTILFASVSSLFRHKDNPHYSAVGASGGVSGILFVFILFNPWATLLLYFIIPMPGIVAAIGYLIYSTWADKRGGGNVAHDAHLYGALFGFFFAILLKPALFTSFMEKLINGLPF
jgi:membrane associated rhomboid family serine protease